MANDIGKSVRDAGTTVFETVRDNPIPVAMIAVGIGWFAVGVARGTDRRRSTRRLLSGARDIREKVGDIVDDAGDAARDVRDKAQELARDARGTAADMARDAERKGRRLARDARIELRRTERVVTRFVRENPLAVGAAALTVGAAIGLALPHTAKEDAWMGASKAKLFAKGRDAAESALHRIEEKVDEIASLNNSYSH